MDDCRMRQTGGRSCRLSMIDRVVDLIADKLNLTRCCELVQAVQFRIANRGASGIVGTVDQNQLGISIHQLLDLAEIDTEVVLLPNSIVASLDPKRFGQGGKGRIAWLRQDNVGSGFRGQPHQNKQCLRGAGYDLNSFDIHPLHLSDGCSQALGSCWADVMQIVIQEAMALLLTGEAKDLIQRPARSFACGQVEFDVVLVGVEPHVQQEGFQLHVTPRRIRSADRQTERNQQFSSWSSLSILDSTRERCKDPNEDRVERCAANQQDEWRSAWKIIAPLQGKKNSNKPGKGSFIDA